MRFLFPKLVLASAVMMAGAMAAAPAMAEVMVDVPFNFTVNGKLCPAGRYQIGHDATKNLVTLRTTTWSRNFTWIAGPGDPGPYESRVVLFGSMITNRLDRKPRPSEYVPTRVIQGQ
jgi:hypothetical protein